MKSYEKLGVFYLGRHHDMGRGATDDTPLLYDAKDLTTHAVCVGMTGSGKTGLCVSLLEEAAIDGIPALVVDPKGDLGNLLLSFPDLRPEDFAPWVDDGAAERKGLDRAAFAAQQATLWRDGLARWDQDGERIRRMRQSAEFALYTPGSEAGTPISILSSFDAPPEAVREDGDLLRDRVASTATSLLSLLGVDADPIRSREHILLSTVFDHHWRQGRGLDLGGLIAAIQNPGVDKVGVMELDTFFPAKDRFDLAMQINSLLAAPGFQAWLQGVPLDVGQLLYTPEGKPRIAVLSIAHLSEAERMFFVSLLLNQTLAWMRGQRGTTSLRALLYMDEIFGYMPPVAQPPSKKPLLTLLKQARAFGLGVVLATQNPVDLDYKGLSNTGTWFIGRLQTERDKRRILEGLEGVATTGGAHFDAAAMDKIVSGLGKRVFLLHNVHEDEPVIFHTRWALSYLCGPLSRRQIKTLAASDAEAAAPAATAPSSAASLAVKASSARSATPTATRPVLDPAVPQAFLPCRAGGESVRYRPALLGFGRVHFTNRAKTVEHREDVALLLPLDDATTIDWVEAEAVTVEERDLGSDPVAGAGFALLPDPAEKPRSYTSWKKALSDHLYRSRRCALHKSPSLGVTSTPGESERDFRIRLRDDAREARDERTAALRKRYASKLDRLEERVRRAEQTVEKEREQAKGQKLQTAISIGATLLSALTGRRSYRRATTAARGFGRSMKESRDIDRAEENLETQERRLAELNEELAAEIEALEDRFDPQLEELETVTLKPRRSDVDVRRVTLAWVPWRDADGQTTPLWP